MGSGQALASFSQVPGGGFFDNYGSKKSPQGIRPVTLSSVVHDTVAADRVTALDNLRLKLGVRGKLTIQLDDDSLRWQWARLVEVDTPRGTDDLTSFPASLTWITASQMWYGVDVSEAAWTWGDLTWTFGDGTVETGEAGTSAALTATGGGSQNFTLTNDGNIDVINLILTITAGTNTITALTVRCNQGGWLWSWTGNIFSTQRLVVDAGQASVRFEGSDYAITSIQSSGSTVTLDSSAVMTQISTGEDIKVFGTTNYDGIHENVTKTDVDQLTYADNIVAATETTGTVRETIDDYANFTPSNRSQWMKLAPGSNTVTVTVTGNAAGDATFAAEFYHHYA